MTQISLIIPLYNGEKYLRDCLDSVAGQTFRDFEVFLVDDGSTDSSGEIAEFYVERYANFHLIRQQNAGVSVARNAGIAASASPYFAFLDQDDVLHPQALEALWYMAEKYKAEVAAFGIQTVPEDFSLSGNEARVDLAALSCEFSERPAASFFHNKKGSPILVWNKLYKRSVMEGILFPPGVQPAEDTVFTMKTVFRVKNMVVCETPFLYYRKSDISIMKQGITEKYIRSHAAAAEEMFAYFFRSRLLSGKDEQRMRFYLTRFVFKSLISQPLRLTGSGSASLQKIELSRELAAGLEKNGAVSFSLLGWRKAAACRLFLSRHYFAAKMLI